MIEQAEKWKAPVGPLLERKLQAVPKRYRDRGAAATKARAYLPRLSLARF